MNIDRGVRMGYKCYICYSHYENGVEHLSSEYRQEIMASCSENFFSEITGDDFDWSMLICMDVLPFCQKCWQSIIKLHELKNKKEATEGIINEIVKNLAGPVLSNRKCLKKKEVSASTSEPSVGDDIKFEDFSIPQNMKCKICYNVYIAGDAQDFISLDISGRIMDICKIHLYPELTDEKFYDWNSIPFNNFVPFCMDCSQVMKRLLQYDNLIKEVEILISDHVDSFTLAVLKCRREIRKLGIGLPENRSLTDSVQLAGSQDTIFVDDNDDDCRIIEDSDPTKDMYPIKFVEANIEEKSTVFDNLAEDTVNDFGEDFQVNENSPPHTESDPVNNDVADSSVQNEERVVPDIPEENSPEPESCRHKRSIASRSNLSLSRASVRIVRLSAESSRTIFKCKKQQCGKIFIYRKCWEEHTAQCCPNSWVTSPIHEEPSEERSCSKSNSKKKSLSNKNPPSIHRCDFCGKSCKSKSGLTLHMRSHTHVNAYKCSKCGRGFAYSNHLKTHNRKEHTETD